MLLLSPALADRSYAQTEATQEKPAEEAVVLLAEEGRGEDGEEGAVGEPEEQQKTVGIEEIKVTAEKREADVQEVPVAISAFSGDQLFEAGVENVDELSFNVPSFHYGEVLGSARITIRGVSSSGGASDQATAFHVDGVYQNSSLIPSGLTFYDLERVEVLRGPQGTLYGRNATGGAINVISYPPSDEYEFSYEQTFGTYSQYLTKTVLISPSSKTN